jgi:putative ABC transport system substrate-binding protein
MDRRTFIATVGGSILARLPAAEAQQAGSAYRLGVLRAADNTRPGDSVDIAIREGLQPFGFVVGRNITIEYRSAEGRYDRLPDLVAELIGLRMDVILVAPTVTALAAKSKTSVIPLVFTSVPDPVGAGLVTTLSRPGGNVTGITSSAHDLTAKRLQLLTEVVPKGRITVLANPMNPNALQQLAETREAAKTLGWSIDLQEAGDSTGLANAFSGISTQRPTAVFLLTDPMFYARRDQIAQLALERKLPTIFELREFVDAGGLMSYGASFLWMYRQAAGHVAKVLKGAKPADLPVEQPTKFELVINLKTAKALGLTIPQSLLVRADEIIQ